MSICGTSTANEELKSGLALEEVLEDAQNAFDLAEKSLQLAIKRDDSIQKRPLESHGGNLGVYFHHMSYAYTCLTLVQNANGALKTVDWRLKRHLRRPKKSYRRLRTLIRLKRVLCCLQMQQPRYVYFELYRSYISPCSNHAMTSS